MRNDEYNVNLDDPKTRVRVVKRDRGPDRMPHYDILSDVSHIVLRENLSLTQVKIVLRDNGWEMIEDN